MPYARFERFHEVMAEDSGQTVLPVLQSHILPLVPGLDQRLKDGIRFLDVGCRRGRALNLLATWFPNSRFVGIDLSEDAIKFARVEAEGGSGLPTTLCFIKSPHSKSTSGERWIT